MANQIDAATRAATLADAIQRGDRRALARAITLAESQRADHRAAAQALLANLPRRDALRLGLTGTPGVGKSSFIEAFGMRLVQAGHRVAVLAVDPSSARTGGAILGDKTRMPRLARARSAFVRPSPSRSSLGGVARRTREAIAMVEAAGYDIVLVETVGVGQSETMVAQLTDIFVLLIAPAGGDDLQGVKRGIMELADLILINKADGALAETAQRTAGDYRAALQLMHPRPGDLTAPAQVMTVSARDAVGIDEAWSAIAALAHMRRSTGVMQAQRQEQAVAALWSELGEDLLARFRSDSGVAAALPAIADAVRAGDRTPDAAAAALIDLYLRRRPDAPGLDARAPSQ
ncbi:MAG: methylmalonyl Co-A mutase-associated GTPase MeaB [Pseudomonadota bacterium]